MKPVIRLETIIKKEGQAILLYRTGKKPYSVKGEIQLNDIGMPCVKKDNKCFEVEKGYRIGITYKNDIFRIYDVI